MKWPYHQTFFGARQTNPTEKILGLNVAKSALASLNTVAKETSIAQEKLVGVKAIEKQLALEEKVLLSQKQRKLRPQPLSN